MNKDQYFQAYFIKITSKKKVIIPLFSIVLFYACSDNKAKDKATGEGKGQVSEAGSTDPTSEDKAIVEWLVGKEWKADEEAAPISILRFFSRDTCGYTTGKYPWSFKNGRFIMMVDWPLAHVNDTTFTLYVEPTKRTFIYRFVKNL
jgi:hypothetical protein